ncbi:hypothetical protein, partial [Helicobacter bizzozeronii]|uniref:hypothetical protein n=1 Tax=Helicobacter bizzozeronii TaxID=56877 RepID=UPI001F43B6AC
HSHVNENVNETNPNRSFYTQITHVGTCTCANAWLKKPFYSHALSPSPTPLKTSHSHIHMPYYYC